MRLTYLYKLRIQRFKYYHQSQANWVVISITVHTIAQSNSHQHHSLPTQFISSPEFTKGLELPLEGYNNYPHWLQKILPSSKCKYISSNFTAISQTTLCWVGQNIHWGFSITSYGKPKRTFWPTQYLPKLHILQTCQLG